MANASEIRNQLANFLSGKLDLEDFDDWIAQNTWNIHKTEDQEAQRLAYAIELRLAEHSSGHLSEDDLRKELQPLVKTHSVLEAQS